MYIVALLSAQGVCWASQDETRLIAKILIIPVKTRRTKDVESVFEGTCECQLMPKCEQAYLENFSGQIRSWDNKRYELNTFLLFENVLTKI